MKVTVIHIIALLVLIVSACKNNTSRHNGVPDELLIGVFAGEGEDVIHERLGPIEKYLERKLGMPVTLIMTTDYSAVIEALRSKKVHVAYLPPFSYVLASKKGDLDLLVAVGSNGKPYSYKSVIITHATSGIKNMNDVKARSKELTLFFPDPASASGHLIPRAYLNTLGLRPDQAFKQTLFASSHPASIMSVKSGKTDLGCTSLTYLKKMIGKGILKENEMIILWMSDPIVTGPVVIRKEINKDFARKLQQAYLDLPQDDSIAWKNYLTHVYGKERSDSLTYIVAYDSTYNCIRKIVRGIDDGRLLQ